MKNKIYASLVVLAVTVFASVSVMAQPGWHKDENGQRNDGYNNRRYDERDDSYGRDNRDYRNNDRNGYYDNGRYVTRHRPDAPRIRPGRRPSPYHVWVDGEWIFSRGQYVYQQGYWAMPVRGMAYVPGHWEKVHKGWYWTPGYWARTANRW